MERLADYKACRSHREIAAIESMFAQFIADQPSAIPPEINHFTDIPQTHETHGD